MLFSLLKHYLELYITGTALKVSRSFYCFTTSISHGVESYFPRVWVTESGYLPLIPLSMSPFIGIKMVNSFLPFYCFGLNKLKHTYNQFVCDVYGKNTKQ